MITEMKAEGKTWNEILAAIGKTSASNLKQHWKDDLERPAAIEVGKKEGEKRKEESKDEGDNKSGKKSKAEKKKDTAEWKAKQDGDGNDKNKGGKDKGKSKKASSSVLVSSGAVLTARLG